MHAQCDGQTTTEYRVLATNPQSVRAEHCGGLSTRLSKHQRTPRLRTIQAGQERVRRNRSRDVAQLELVNHDARGSEQR